MAKLLAISADPDQTPRSAASDLGLHCELSFLRVSRLQWVNDTSTFEVILRRFPHKNEKGLRR